ncbi:TerB family tellurite resistance protein [Octadecabacter sp.]|nr:TerB family tellurite resistance protein [Octadecabacter sp.]
MTSGECDNLASALWKVADADGQRHDTEEKVVAIATQGFVMSPEAAAALRS